MSKYETLKKLQAMERTDEIGAVIFRQANANRLAYESALLAEEEGAAAPLPTGDSDQEELQRLTHQDPIGASIFATTHSLALKRERVRASEAANSSPELNDDPTGGSAA